MNSIRLAKFFMKLCETYPISPENSIGELQEVFQHDFFVKSSDEKKTQIMLASSGEKYRSELQGAS